MIQLSDIATLGHDLDRPESVLATRDGSFYVSHRGHGVCHIAADGTQTVLAPPTTYRGQPLLPNGIALQKDGSFLIANISDAGGIFHLDGGKCLPFVTELDGNRMPPVNFVTVDETGRIWFSVSSTVSPRHLAYRRDVKNGFVGVIENGRARVVLRGLHYTNEIRPDFLNGWLYVSETFSQQIARFRLSDTLEIGQREIFARFPKGAFVDGIALDAEGGMVAACIVSNELFHISSDGAIRCLISEREDEWVAEVEAALDTATMNRRHFDETPSKQLMNISSVAFYGQDLDRLTCGSLLGDCLLTLPAPVTGRPPVHW